MDIRHVACGFAYGLDMHQGPTNNTQSSLWDENVISLGTSRIKCRIRKTGARPCKSRPKPHTATAKKKDNDNNNANNNSNDNNNDNYGTLISRSSPARHELPRAVRSPSTEQARGHAVPPTVLVPRHSAAAGLRHGETKKRSLCREYGGLTTERRRVLL